MSDNKIVVTIDEDLEELIPGFLKNRTTDLQTLKDAHKQKNFEKIKHIGHSLKGVGGGYGFHGLSEIGAAIEQAAKNQDVKTIAVKIKEMSHYLESVEIVYE